MKNILYESTRGGESGVNASTAILNGLAHDGGLYVPHEIPVLDKTLDELSNMDYKQIANYIMQKFLTDFTASEINECIVKAYDDKFDSNLIAPLISKSDIHFLELFHGPTLAFKDMALTILPHLMKIATHKNGVKEKIVILTATSGDTGKAALEGFADIEGIEIIVFYPQDGVSEIQKKQMTTQTGQNTHVIAIKGNFDDAQNGVKAIYNDKEFNENLFSNGYKLSSANSINIGRLIPQIVYYFSSYIQLCNRKTIKPGENINFVVPTGNFGNILAGFYAKEMGLPINHLICASNENNILYDFFKTGTYDINRKFLTTISPSMDILISSNLERLIYITSGRNSGLTNSYMNNLKRLGCYTLSNDIKEKMLFIHAQYVTEEETMAAIKGVHSKYDYIIDPHTAVAYAAYIKYKAKNVDDTATVILSTASPYKFPKDVLSSINKNIIPNSEFDLIEELSNISNTIVPESIKELMHKPINHNLFCDKLEMKKVVETILKGN